MISTIQRSAAFGLALAFCAYACGDDTDEGTQAAGGAAGGQNGGRAGSAGRGGTAGSASPGGRPGGGSGQAGEVGDGGTNNQGGSGQGGDSGNEEAAGAAGAPCNPLYAVPIDESRDCVMRAEGAVIVGCSPLELCSEDAVCVRRKSDGAQFLGYGSSCFEAASDEWEECVPRREVYADCSEVSNAGAGGQGSSGEAGAGVTH